MEEIKGGLLAENRGRRYCLSANKKGNERRVRGCFLVVKRLKSGVR